MPFQLSPGVLVTERDLTAIVPAVSTTAGAFAGNFQWGPADTVITVDSENKLVEVYGKPDGNTFASFFTAANFLSYGNNLQVVRVLGASARNAVANASSGAAVLIENEDDYLNNYNNGEGTAGFFAAKYPGGLGNSLRVSMGDANAWASWAYSSSFDSQPTTSTYASSFGSKFDELHVIVIDEDGLWTGTAGSVLERFPFVSKASDAKKPDGSTNYYKDVINQTSKYIWWMDHPESANVSTNNWGTAATSNVTYGNLTPNTGITVSLTGGHDGALPASGNVETGYALFSNDEKYDVSLICTGNVSSSTATYIINNVAEVRKDCVVFLSPSLANVLNTTTPATNAVNFRNNLPSTSYAVMDSGWKYQYDRYNDQYRWVPLNGDVAGCTVRTDYVADPWFSPAGLNRGQIKNVVKLAFSPTKTERDTLYKSGINPVVSFPGQGTVLFGDKTLLAKPSAFDRINVRRLFIVLEKAIATAAKFQLFEFNDEFTRSQFRNLVEPFLRDVQGRRGIIDFKVVCDETNNTGEVIDRNEFIADIYIKPNRSINFIQLNFIATRSNISFEEVGA